MGMSLRLAGYAAAIEIEIRLVSGTLRTTIAPAPELINNKLHPEKITTAGGQPAGCRSWMPDFAGMPITPLQPDPATNGFIVPRSCSRIGVPGRSNVSRRPFSKYRW